MAVSKDRGLLVAVQYMGKAVPKMKELGIPPSPANFTLWYEYFKGRNQALSRELDRIMDTGRVFTAEINGDLYERYFGGNSEAQLEEVRKAIRGLISQLSEQLSDISEDMDNYDQVLSSCESRLSAGADIDTLRELVSNLLQETRKIRESNCATSKVIEDLNAEINMMRRTMEQLNEEVLIDSLTGISNRRAFDQELSDAMSKAGNNGTACCLLLLDIDYFKQFNDEHGHLVGDRVLRFVAEMIKKSVKGRDFVARYGGEEFAVILPNTDYGGGMAVARAIADTIANQKLTLGKGKRAIGGVTLSIGLSIFRPGDDASSIIGRSDDCLYSAKSKGRNGVVGERDNN